MIAGMVLWLLWPPPLGPTDGTGDTNLNPGGAANAAALVVVSDAFATFDADDTAADMAPPPMVAAIMITSPTPFMAPPPPPPPLPPPPPPPPRPSSLLPTPAVVPTASSRSGTTCKCLSHLFEVK